MWNIFREKKIFGNETKTESSSKKNSGWESGCSRWKLRRKKNFMSAFYYHKQHKNFLVLFLCCGSSLTLSQSTQFSTSFLTSRNSHFIIIREERVDYDLRCLDLNVYDQKIPMDLKVTKKFHIKFWLHFDIMSNPSTNRHLNHDIALLPRFQFIAPFFHV